MEASLIAYLISNNVASGRVYPVSAPQHTAFPYVAVTRISGGPEYADDGETGLENSRVQMDCRGLTYADAKDLAILVKSILSGVRDLVYSGTTFRYIMVSNELDMRDAGFRDLTEYLYCTAVDFEIWSVR